MRRRGVAAPDRDLQRVHRFARAAGAQVDAADQQVRLGLVGRQEHRAPQLRHRLAILLRLVQPAAALEMELREVAAGRAARSLLIAWSMPLRADRRRDPGAPARGRAAAVAPAPTRRRPAATTAARRSRARAPASTPLPAASSAAASTKCASPSAGFAPQRLAQPVDRALRIAIERVGVAEIEQQIRIVGLGLGRLREVVGRLAGFGRRRRGAAGSTPRLFRIAGSDAASCSS